MDSTEFLRAGAAYGALLVSAISLILTGRSAKLARRRADMAAQAVQHAQRQADMAERAVEHAHQIGHGASLTHFTSLFLDLTRDGHSYTNPHWSYRFWTLQRTEFYFFEYGWLPAAMYQLWMVDVASSYRQDPDVWPSHEQYLSRYAVNYPSMLTFFNRLHAIAGQDYPSEERRNADILRHVEQWSGHPTANSPGRPRVPIDLHRPVVGLAG